jgi:hypothetical protein
MYARSIRRGTLVLAAALVGSQASAHESRCEGVRIRAAADLTPEWANAVLQAQRDLAASDEIDCVDVWVEPSPDGRLRVVATASDGRRAERFVWRRSALTPTIFGLVASIPAEATDEPPAASHPSWAWVPAPVSVDARGAPSRPPVEVWLGLAAGMRVTQPAVFEMLDFEGRVDVVVRAWSLFGSLRYSIALRGPTPTSSEYSEADVGVGVGRRISLGATRLDLGFIPSLATTRLEDDDETGLHGTVVEFRVGASIRWSVPVNPFWRLTVAADTDLSPEGLRRPVRVEPDLPPLPAWTGGVRVGASGELL